MKKPAYSAYDREGHRKYLTRNEGHIFLKHARKLALRQSLFCQAIYYSGMRISEALALTKADIDRESGVILIRTLKKRRYEEIRRIPLPGWLIVALLKLETPTDESPLWPFSRTTGWRVIKRVMAQAGIAGIHATTKGLRHAFGVRGVMDGLPITLIQEILGHSQIETTRIYLDVRDAEKRALLERTWK